MRYKHVSHEVISEIGPGDSNFGKIRQNPIRDRLSNTHIKIGGDKYKIGFRSRMVDRFQVYAQTDFFNNTMLFEVNLTEGNLISSLLHEIIEVINRKHNLKFDHDTITSLEVALFDVLTDNPSVLRELLTYAKKMNR